MCLLLRALVNAEMADGLGAQCSSPPPGLLGSVSACLMHIVFVGGVSHTDCVPGQCNMLLYISAAFSAVYVVAATSVLMQVVCICEHWLYFLHDKALTLVRMSGVGALSVHCLQRRLSSAGPILPISRSVAYV